jgi:hypothetical protein
MIGMWSVTFKVKGAFFCKREGMICKTQKITSTVLRI